VGSSGPFFGQDSEKVGIGAVAGEARATLYTGGVVHWCGRSTCARKSPAVDVSSPAADRPVVMHLGQTSAVTVNTNRGRPDRVSCGGGPEQILESAMSARLSRRQRAERVVHILDEHQYLSASFACTPNRGCSFALPSGTMHPADPRASSRPAHPQFVVVYAVAGCSLLLASVWNIQQRAIECWALESLCLRRLLQTRRRLLIRASTPHQSGGTFDPNTRPDTDETMLTNVAFTNTCCGRRLASVGGCRALFESTFWCVSQMVVTWLILPVVICLSQRLSHACLSVNNVMKLRMAH
jgi:hypothetical protein